MLEVKTSPHHIEGGLNMSEVTAYVEEIDGQLVLHDPMAEGVIAVVNERNREVAYEKCQCYFDDSRERVEYFRRRVDKLGLAPKDVCMVILQVDDVHGAELSEILLPNEDWGKTRAQGLEPIARGLVYRSFVHDAVAQFDSWAASELEQNDGYVVLVVAYGVAKVFVA